MELPTLDNYSFKNKRVLVRVDFNVPIDKEGDILNDRRLQSSLPTIQYLLDNGAAQIIMIAHLGRPKGEIVEKLKLDKVADRFSGLIGQEVAKTDSCIDIDMPYNKLVLLENIRFHKEEKSKNDFERQEFAKQIADYADIYVNDSFGVDHRKHASLYDITKFIPGCIGKLVQKELKMIGDCLKNPKKPFIAIMGGAKVSDKFGAISELLKKVDKILLGGAMIFTFYKALGKNIGKSLVEDNMVSMAKEIYNNYEGKIILPVDVIGAEGLDVEDTPDVYSVDNIPDNIIGLDIGPESVNLFRKHLKSAETIVWNGPMGKFEDNRYSLGTKEIAAAIAQGSAISIAGGGETEEAIEEADFIDRFTHVSTGGGASLELFEGKNLVALEALKINWKVFGKK